MIASAVEPGGIEKVRCACKLAARVHHGRHTGSAEKSYPVIARIILHHLPFTNDFHDCCLLSSHCSVGQISQIALSRVVLVKETKHSGSPTQKRRNCSVVMIKLLKILNLMRVEDVMPIATGHEREELEAELQGKDLLGINFPEGPFGTKITDAVVAASILNATLVVPKLDKTSFWKNSSGFSDIFDVDWFINHLKTNVSITIEGDGDKELPDEDKVTGSRLVHEGKSVIKDCEFNVETVNGDIQCGDVTTLQAKGSESQQQEQS